MRDVLGASGIRCDILYFEKPAARSDIMKFIDEDSEAIYGVFISEEDSELPSVALYYNSERERNRLSFAMPLTVMLGCSSSALTDSIVLC